MIAFSTPFCVRQEDLLCYETTAPSFHKILTGSDFSLRENTPLSLRGILTWIVDT